MIAPTKHGAAPLGVVKRDEEEFREWVATEQGFMQAFGSFDEAPLKLEAYQLRFLQNRSSYRAVEKSRQVGYSFVFAVEALARSHLRETQTSVFVSYNLADAKEKIGYCQQLHEELPLEYQKKRIVDSKLEIAFRSNRAHGRVSRIISNPSKAPRGKKGDIYLDELAHCANDREIYKGSTALIIRARGGQLTVCSTPLGRRGIFWEIAREELRPYSYYWRQKIPWWLCSQFCTDIPRAALHAPGMPTAERVEKFGNKKIKEQFGSLPLEDFQQEFEVVYSDETLSFFPYDLIIPCTSDLQLATDFSEIEVPSGVRLVAGYDVGRKNDKSELSIFSDDGYRKTCLMVREYDRVPFHVQESDLRYALELLPIARLSIDNSTIGLQLVENLSRDYPQVVGEDFSNTSKELWCTDFKIGLQRREIMLPADRDLITQVHGIKKHVTPAGKVVFDAERNAKGHADKFWSMALACKKERGEVRSSGLVGVRVLG